VIYRDLFTSLHKALHVPDTPTTSMDFSVSAFCACICFLILFVMQVYRLSQCVGIVTPRAQAILLTCPWPSASISAPPTRPATRTAVASGERVHKFLKLPMIDETGSPAQYGSDRSGYQIVYVNRFCCITQSITVEVPSPDFDYNLTRPRYPKKWPGC
jgi:hypothetical protein